MTKLNVSACDKLTYKVIAQYGCQSSQQVRTCMNRLYNDSYSVSSIGASLRKMEAKGIAASSDNGHGRKVYWLTEFGREHSKDYD